MCSFRSWLCCSLNQNGISIRVGSRLMSTGQDEMFKRPTFAKPMPPKPPLSSFMLFLKDNRHRKVGYAVDSWILFTKEMSIKWKEMPEHFQEMYRARYLTNLELHKKKYQRFLDQQIGEDKEKQKEYLNSLKIYKEKRRKFVSNIKKLVKPRKVSAYSAFISDFAAKNTGKLSRRWLVEAGMAFKELSSEELEEYTRRANHLTAKRIMEYHERVEAEGLEEVSEQESDVSYQESDVSKQQSDVSKQQSDVSKHESGITRRAKRSIIKTTEDTGTT